MILCCDGGAATGEAAGLREHLKKIVEPAKWEIIDSLEFIGVPNKEDLQKGEAFGSRFATRIQER